MRKQKFRPPAKLIVIIIVICIGIFIIGESGKSLRNAGYFRIKEIIIKSGDTVNLSNLKGHNIFEVDLNKLSRHLEIVYPNYKKIMVVRILPDKLFVDFIKRTPEAYIKLYKYYYIDRDAVVFDALNFTGDPGLPVITGLETKLFGVKSGRAYDLNEIKSALEIIREIKKSRALRDYRIKRIDVASLDNSSVFLTYFSGQDKALNNDNKPVSDLLEVKIGQGNIFDKVNILNSLLSQVNSDRFNIKYIDLRFKEPVIKLKDNEKKR